MELCVRSNIIFGGTEVEMNLESKNTHCFTIVQHLLRVKPLHSAAEIMEDSVVIQHNFNMSTISNGDCKCPGYIYMKRYGFKAVGLLLSFAAIVFFSGVATLMSCRFCPCCSWNQKIHGKKKQGRLDALRAKREAAGLDDKTAPPAYNPLPPPPTQMVPMQVVQQGYYYPNAQVQPGPGYQPVQPQPMVVQQVPASQQPVAEQRELYGYPEGYRSRRRNDFTRLFDFFFTTRRR